MLSRKNAKYLSRNATTVCLIKLWTYGKLLVYPNDISRDSKRCSLVWNDINHSSSGGMHSILYGLHTSSLVYHFPLSATLACPWLVGVGNDFLGFPHWVFSSLHRAADFSSFFLTNRITPLDDTLMKPLTKFSCDYLFSSSSSGREKEYGGSNGVLIPSFNWILWWYNRCGCSFLAFVSWKSGRKSSYSFGTSSSGSVTLSESKAMFIS